MNGGRSPYLEGEKRRRETTEEALLCISSIGEVSNRIERLSRDILEIRKR